MANGIIRKLSFVPRTLDDYMVRDGLEAASLLDKQYLVGGIATQSYLPTICRRPTSDIDFSVVRPLSYRDFKSMIKIVREYLHDKGYTTETKKHSRSYALNVLKLEEEGLCLEFSRRNKQSFENREKRLERELENAKSKIIEGRETTYKVCCVEDIAVPKLVRSIGSLKRNPHFFKYISGEIDPLTDEIVERQLKNISEIREEAMINLPNPELAEKLRFVSDLYDIRILSEITGFNEKYFAEVGEEWDTFKNPSEARERLVKAVLPKFL